MLQDQVKSVVTSKLNIFIFSISMIPHIAGWKDFFIKYGENMDVLILSFFVMIALFFIYVFRNRKESKKAVDDLEIKSSLNFKSNDIKFKGINLLPKLLSSMLILIIVITVSFLFFLKDATVYYIKVSDNLNINEAIAQKNKVRSIFVLNGNEQYIPTIRRRSIRSQPKNYFLSINGAFLDKNKAEIQFEKIKILLSKNKNIRIVPNSTTHISRKIEYLIAHVIPYKILYLFSE